MNKGQIEQIGAPAEVYERPQSEFVASFLGNANFLAATVTGGREDAIEVKLADGSPLVVGGGNLRPVKPGDQVRVVVRAEKIMLKPAVSTPIAGKIVDVDYLGALARYDIDLAGGQRVRALSSLHERAHASGEPVALAIDPEHCRIL
jgi:ABC-type Fe3+/spermidine/putrescine transport system ATPase subunit